MSAQELAPPLCLRLTCQNNNKIASLRAANAAKNERIADLEKASKWLAIVLDHVDYTSGAGQPNEMVGALLPHDVIKLARAALTDTGAA